MSGEILRVAAKGDGITADGQHVAFAAPGDVIQPDGTLLPGPHHATPPCRHFGTCGGCQLQHLDEETLAQFVSDRVLNAAEGQGLVPEKVAPPHLSPPNTRRRATLRAINGGGRPLIGFNEAGSHRVVDMKENFILAPELIALLGPLRALLGTLRGKYAAEIDLTLADQGVDCGIKGVTFEGYEAMEALNDFARDTKLARLTMDMGYGAEALWEPEPVTVTLSGVPVGLPSGGFLQATADSEAALVGAAREWLAGAAQAADLFSGLGTFAFALAGQGAKVSAYEAARDIHLACKQAAGRAQLPVEAVHRDLFRNPLQADELERFDAVLLDPPRAGARDQIETLAISQVPQIAYISCNPSSWARDAKTLVDGGYRLAELRPVGQFRWSTHVELASLFVK
jgi:23S rRNA (uracil1939-C5)-methyltransferase